MNGIIKRDDREGAGSGVGGGYRCYTSHTALAKARGFAIPIVASYESCLQYCWQLMSSPQDICVGCAQKGGDFGHLLSSGM
jgi:hypothetical protein